MSGAGSEAADRLILRGALSTGAGFLVRFGARFVFLFIAGRLFGAALFGAFTLAIAVVEAGIGLGGLAMKKMLFQLLDAHGEASGRPAFHTVVDAALLVFLTSTALAALIMTAAWLLPPDVLSPATGTALFWLAPMIAGQGILDVILAATRWKQAIRYEVIGRSIVEPYSLVAGAAGAWLLGFEAHGLIIGYWLGNAMVTLYALAGAKRCFGDLGLSTYRIRTARLWRTFRLVLPNTGTDVVSGIYTRIDIYLVGIFLGERWAGIYGMANQVRTPVRQVRQSFDGLLIPIVTRTLPLRGAAATREALATASRFILAVQMPFAIGIAAIGIPLLELFGQGFGAGYAALLLLVTAEVIHGAYGLGDLLFVYLRPRTGFWTMLAGLAVSGAAAIILIPMIGISGGGLAVLLAQLVQAALRRHLLRSKLGASVPIAHDALPLAAGATGIAAVVLLLDTQETTFGLNPLVTLLAGLAAYAAVTAAWLKASGQSLSIRGFRAELEDAGP